MLSFVAVVKSGGYSAAAKETGVSKALLSRHVAQLELHLGHTLLYRTTRTLSLTEIGQSFYAQAVLVEESYNNALSSVDSDISGNLRITTAISLGSEILPEIIHQFTKRYPKIKVSLSLSSVAEDIVEQRFDVGIRVAYNLPDSMLKMKPLFSFEMKMCAAASYLAEHAAPADLTDLNQHQCITSVLRNNDQQSVSWSFIKNKKIVKQNIKPHIQVDSIRAQLELVRLGSGIGRLPAKFIGSLLTKNELVEILSCTPPLPLNVFALYPNVQFVPKKTRCFLDFMTQYCQAFL
jgi:DNA-binding transcriptional LysR family regulator